MTDKNDKDPVIICEFLDAVDCESINSENSLNNNNNEKYSLYSIKSGNMKLSIEEKSINYFINENVKTKKKNEKINSKKLNNKKNYNFNNKTTKEEIPLAPKNKNKIRFNFNKNYLNKINIENICPSTNINIKYSYYNDNSSKLPINVKKISEKKKLNNIIFNEKTNKNYENKYNEILKDQNMRKDCFDRILKKKDIIINQQKQKIEELSNNIYKLKLNLEEKDNINKNLQIKICKLQSDLLLITKNKNISDLYKNKNKKKKKKLKVTNHKINDFKSVNLNNSNQLRELITYKKESKNSKMVWSITPKNNIQNKFCVNNVKSLTNSGLNQNIGILNDKKKIKNKKKNENKYKFKNEIYNNPSSNSNVIKKIKINKNNFCFNNKSNPSKLENFKNKYNNTYYNQKNDLNKEKNYKSGVHLKNKKEKRNLNNFVKKILKK